MEINFSNKTLGANFQASGENMTINGSYRSNPDTKALTELSFNGNVGGNNFNGSVDEQGRLSIWGVAMENMTTVTDSITEIIASIQGNKKEEETSIEEQS